MLQENYKIAKKFNYAFYTCKCKECENMIQPLNYTNANYVASQKQSFGQNPETVSGRKRPSTAARLAGYTATQFAAGAIVSGIFDGLTNLYRAIAKNKPAMPLKEMAGRAGFTGAAFAVIGLVFTAIGAAMARRKDN